MIRRTVLAGLAAALAAEPADAQFSSDFPGVPRAAISIRGGRQKRTEWSLMGNKIPVTTGTGDSIGGGVRLGFGRSYRIRDQFEVGFDYSFMDLTFQQPPTGTVASGSSKASYYMRGMLAYGFRFGAKMRPYSSIDPDGNGYQVAVGVGYQPKLKTLFGVERLRDSTRTGGQFSGKDSTGTPSTVFARNPFASIQSSTSIAAMGSYRSKRLLGDAALMNESVGKADPMEGPSPLGSFKGFSLRLGGSYRLTRGFAVGGSYWGSGSPPWRDEVRIAIPGEAKALKYALLLQFGSQPEGGTDLMLTSPTGNFGQSVRLYIRTRSTR